MTNEQQQYPGTFEGSDYTEYVTDHLRILITNESGDFDSPACVWTLQAFDDDLGWYRITSSPKRQQFSFDRAIDLARHEAQLIRKELENPHKPMMGGGK